MSLSKIPAEIGLQLLKEAATVDGPGVSISKSTFISMSLASSTMHTLYEDNRKLLLREYLTRTASVSFLRLFDTLARCPSRTAPVTDLLEFLMTNIDGVETDFDEWDEQKLGDCLRCLEKVKVVTSSIEYNGHEARTQMCCFAEDDSRPQFETYLDDTPQLGAISQPLDSTTALLVALPTAPPVTNPVPKTESRASSSGMYMAVLDAAFRRRTAMREAELEALDVERDYWKIG